MLHLYTAHTADLVTLTLAEKTTLSDARYLMVLRPVVNGDPIRFLLPVPVEAGRCNTYQLNTEALLLAAGEYRYHVYEQAGEALDETGLNEVETGILWVHRTGVTYNSYEAGTAYNTYK